MSLHVLVLAGGSGTRLWPLSRAATPKHLLPLGPGGTSLLRATVERVLPLGAAIHVLTTADQVAGCRQALDGLELGPDPIIAEPSARGTGPALALATGWIARDDPEALICSVHADHHVGDAAAYRVALWAVAGWARGTGGLATVGLVPGSPNPGFGYIQVGEPRPAAEWVSPVGPAGPLDLAAAALPGLAGAGFVEKPRPELAEAFVAGGRHLWNLGLFAWPAPVFAAALRSSDAGLAAGLDRVVAARSAGDEAGAARLYGGLRSIAVEPLIFEPAQDLTVVRAAFPWSDLGSWSDLLAARLEAGPPRSAATNAVTGDGIAVGSRGCLVDARGGRLVAVVGAEDMVVVDTGDAVLVVPAARAQSVREVVDALRAAGRTELL